MSDLELAPDTAAVTVEAPVGAGDPLAVYLARLTSPESRRAMAGSLEFLASDSSTAVRRPPRSDADGDKSSGCWPATSPGMPPPRPHSGAPVLAGRALLASGRQPALGRPPGCAPGGLAPRPDDRGCPLGHPPDILQSSPWAVIDIGPDPL